MDLVLAGKATFTDVRLKEEQDILARAQKAGIGLPVKKADYAANFR